MIDQAHWAARVVHSVVGTPHSIGMVRRSTGLQKARPFGFDGFAHSLDTHRITIFGF